MRKIFDTCVSESPCWMISQGEWIRWLVHFVLNRQEWNTWKGTSYQIILFVLGYDSWARMYEKIIHWRFRLSNKRRDVEIVLREMGKNRRRCSDERSKDKKISWIRLYFVLAIEHGRWRTSKPSSCHRWKVSQGSELIYSTSSDSRFTLIEFAVSLLLHQCALGIACSFSFTML